MYKKILRMENIPEKLINIGERVVINKNDFLYNTGDKMEDMFILLKGKVLVITEHTDGSSIYEALMLPKCVIGEMVIVDEKIISPHTFKCIEISELVKISKQELEDSLVSDHDILMYLYKTTNHILGKFVIQSNEYATLSAQERIANILVEFVEEFGIEKDQKIKINYKISQQFISNLVGVRILTTARILKKLNDENIAFYKDGYYFIKNLELLKQYSNNPILEI